MEEFDDSSISEEMRKALLSWREIEERQLKEIFEQKSKTIVLPTETL